MTFFKKNVGKLLDWLNPQSDTIAVMTMGNCQIYNKGFIQSVKQPTTENGTLIYHVYVKTSHHDVESLALLSYFSDHI